MEAAFPRQPARRRAYMHANLTAIRRYWKRALQDCKFVSSRTCHGKLQGWVLLYLLGPERTLSKISVLSMVSQSLLNFLSTSISTRYVLNLLSIKYWLSINDSFSYLQNLNWENIDVGETLRELWSTSQSGRALYGYWGDIDQILMHSKHRENNERGLYLLWTKINGLMLESQINNLGQWPTFSGS